MCIDCWRALGSPQIDGTPIRVARDLIGHVYNVSCVGGGLHIVVYDWNLDDADLDDCLSRPLSKLDRECGEVLRKMTVAERASALGLFDGYWRLAA